MQMDEWTVTATANGYVLSTKLHECVCLVGKAGLIAAGGKREGDMATPVGSWPLRRVYFRPDRMAPPKTSLPLVPIHKNLGWCDDPDSPSYNRAIELPFAGSHETMWRDDSLYDIVVELGYNDAPPVVGLGSAIFLHLREAHTLDTAGCVAVTRDDMLVILAEARPATTLRVTG
jgi:L,D-peptidoglycan transpeptidase YkuD (ErfK/YbiS/YcfS/YnhG family)